MSNRVLLYTEQDFFFFNEEKKKEFLKQKGHVAQTY